MDIPSPDNTPPMPPTLGEALLDRYELINHGEYERVLKLEGKEPMPTIQFLQYRNYNDRCKTFCSLGVSKLKYPGAKGWEMLALIEVTDTEELKDIPVAMMYAIEYIIDHRIFPTSRVVLPLPDDCPFFAKYGKRHVYVGLPVIVKKSQSVIQWGGETISLVMMLFITDDEYALAKAEGVKALEDKFFEKDVEFDLSRKTCL